MNNQQIFLLILGASLVSGTLYHINGLSSPTGAFYSPQVDSTSGSWLTENLKSILSSLPSDISGTGIANQSGVKPTSGGVVLANYTESASFGGGGWNATHPSAPDCSSVNYNGSGTSSDPYEISNDWQLQCVRQKSLDSDYELVRDIDASLTEQWNSGKGFKPIGKPSWKGKRFNGVFDGNKFSIRNLYINRTNTDYIGLFGSLGSNSTVNARVEDLILKSSTIRGAKYTGGIVGSNRGGEVVRVGFEGNLSGTSNSAGIAGSSYSGSTIYKSYTSGSVTGDSYTGGIVGRNFANISDSYSRANIDGYYRAGGLVGYNDQGSISRSYSTGTVTGNSGLGGLVGYNIGTVSDSYWDTISSGQSSSDGGTGLNTSEMQGVSAKTSMAGLNFNQTWEVVKGEYPIFR